ncbi:MAG: tetratricopeptide repeat-containing sensor histidine kinase, partial [Bacteroidota bacterium]|nr:tetratricopeptide repeat-containing sensor histidine kinase [Bacteroidota bacterium]
LLVALEIRQSLNDQKGIAESYNSIGLLYFRQKKWDTAIAHANLALKNGQEAQAQEQIFKSYELLSQAYKNLGEYRDALSFKELSLAINELVQSEKHERELLETQSRYVVAKKESEIQKLEVLRLDRERELAAQKKFRNILFLVAVLIFITAGLLLILYLVKRRSNRVLLVAKKEVQQQNEKLQELNNTKDKFFSIISHDLKGPLNSLTSFSRLLIDHTDSMSKEEIQLLAKDLDRSVKNLLTLLENLLEWSRSQTGNIDFSPEEFDLGEILETNKSLLQAQAGAKQIEIITGHSGPFTVRLHRQSINTVVRNLLSNAIKFSNPGGTIRTGIIRDDAWLNVFIADSGVGMTPDVIDKIFRLDSKHSTRGTANEKGTGLGLILCREFIEKNGGTIRVESTPGKGSVFTCSFPVTVLSKPAALKSTSVSF